MVVRSQDGVRLADASGAHSYGAPRVVWVSARSEAARTAVRRRSPWDIAKSEFMVEEVVVEERED